MKFTKPESNLENFHSIALALQKEDVWFEEFHLVIHPEYVHIVIIHTVIPVSTKLVIVFE